jgi:hypothetical protein
MLTSEVNALFFMLTSEVNALFWDFVLTSLHDCPKTSRSPISNGTGAKRETFPIFLNSFPNFQLFLMLDLLIQNNEQALLSNALIYLWQ